MWGFPFHGDWVMQFNGTVYGVSCEKPSGHSPGSFLNVS
jgi:hypothetical protein